MAWCRCERTTEYKIREYNRKLPPSGAIVLCKQACVTLLSYFSQNSETSSLPLLFTYLPLSFLLRQLSPSPDSLRFSRIQLSCSLPLFTWWRNQCVLWVLCVFLCANVCKLCMTWSRWITPYFFRSGERVLKFGTSPCNFFLGCSHIFHFTHNSVFPDFSHLVPPCCLPSDLK